MTPTGNRSSDAARRDVDAAIGELRGERAGRTQATASGKQRPRAKERRTGRALLVSHLCPSHSTKTITPANATAPAVANIVV